MARRILYLILTALLLSALALADEAIQGNYAGDWSGSAGASGMIKILVEWESGKPKCTVSFTLAGSEIKTNVTLCKIEGTKIETQYDWDYSGNRVQSTVQGEKKGAGLAGTYHSKVLADGSQLDEGEWKAEPAK
jgi:hypothetical protein